MIASPSMNLEGLTRDEAALQLQKTGPNEVPSVESRGTLRILASVAREPMVALLIACAAIYFALGEIGDGFLLAFSVSIVIAITLYQEWKSEKAVEALRDLSSPRALVVRDGNEVRIAGREVVPGDLLILSEGDRVAADAELLDSKHLKVDESLLTGESVPVSKGLSGADSQVYSGTLIVAGRGLGKVTATGPASKLGLIGQSLREEKKDDRTLLQRELGQLVRIFGVIGLVSSLFIALTYGFMRGDWPEGILVGLATAMSLLPEEFPVVLTVFLAMGAWRISRAQVLVRRISATESLGSISVLCVDKTGTLTQNQMAVRILDGNDPSELIRIGALACPVDSHDPMDKAIRRRCQETPNSKDALDQEGWRIIREYPLTHDLLAMTFVWKVPAQTAYWVATKGAPEAVLDLCRIAGAEREAILARVRAHAQRGLRLLAVARTEHADDLFPERAAGFSFRFVGLIGLEDPIRPEAPVAVRECYDAGVRVIMMTGDFSETARSIAGQIGLDHPDTVITGAELRSLSELNLGGRIRSVNVFARMVPEQKLRIINALRSEGQIVAMTGDGVNDAPSLKWADVGIAMGGRGTDVAREAASIVLLDDCFSSIVTAIQMGRRIFDNIRKAVAFIIAVHVPIAGIAIVPVLLNLPVVLLPAHIVFLELIIDPACALIFEGEAAEPNIMKRPPRSLSKPLFGAREIGKDLAQGGIALASVLAAYFIGLSRFSDAGNVRTITFMSLVFSNLGLIWVNRSTSSKFLDLFRLENRAFAWLGLGAFSLLALILFLPATQAMFRMQAPTGLGILIALGSGALTVLGSYAVLRFSKAT